MRGVGIAVLAFTAGISVSFFTLPLWVTFVINAAKEGSRSDWLGFAGSVVGAGVALIAAGIAWFAVQQQIEAQRLAIEQARTAEVQKVERHQAEAKAAARIVLTHTIHAAAAALNVRERTLELRRIEPQGKSRTCSGAHCRADVVCRRHVVEGSERMNA